MQDVCVKISSVRLLVPWKSEIATLPAFRVMDTHVLRRWLHFEIRNRTFTSISRDGHARSPQRVALRNQKTQFHLHSAHSTHTISTEGCTSKSKKAISPAFRALDLHDLRRGFPFRNPKNAISPAFRALDTHDLRRGFTFEKCFRSTEPATKS